MRRNGFLKILMRFFSALFIISLVFSLTLTDVPNLIFGTSTLGTYENPYGPSPTMVTAITLPINAFWEVWHTFPSSGINYAKFSATAGKRYQLYVSAGYTFSSIIDSSGTVLASYTISVNNVSLYWTCPSSGTYYVKTEKRGYPYSKYCLGITETSPDSFEPNESFDQATEIQIDSGEYPVTLCSLTEEEVDYDYYKFNVEAGKTYTIMAKSDVYISEFAALLFDAYGKSPSQAIGGGGGGRGGTLPGGNNPFTLTFTPSQSGVYYLRIDSVPFFKYGIYTLKITSNAPPSSPPRIFGENRYQTAAEVSKENWTSSNYVVIATGENFPDALSGAPLAKAYDAPLLLVTKDSLPSETIAEINRLGATEAIVLGGEGAISNTIVSSLQAQTSINSVTRIGGQNRYDTAKEIALKLKEKLGTQISNTAVVATGENFPDALAIAGFAGYKNMPILLVGKDTIPSETQDAISSLGITSSIVVGGTGVISDAVKENLPSPTRLSGENRYQTAKEIAEYAASYGMSWETTYITTGTNFPDALSCGALCAKNGCIMLLTNPTSLGSSPDTRTILLNNKTNITNIYLIGGSGAISEKVGSQISATVN